MGDLSEEEVEALCRALLKTSGDYVDGLFAIYQAGHQALARKLAEETGTLRYLRREIDKSGV